MDLISPMVRRLVREAADDTDRFWDQEASRLAWFRRWDKVLDWTPPTFRWFVGAETNLAWNCLDRHVQGGRSGHTALIAIDEHGDRRALTYGQLLSEVERVAAGLRALGVGKGDTVTVYMPTSAEAIVLMLATVRIGAVHSVVFAGFGAGALAERVRLAGSRVIFIGDMTWRKGTTIDLKTIADQALDALAAGGVRVRHCVVLRRIDCVPMTAGRDLSWDEFVAAGEQSPADGGHAVMGANDPAFILATSGTTSTPKLAVHVHGGYQVGVHAAGRWTMGLSPDDVWWATSDIGWIVGHSYMVYAPLLAGATTLRPVRRHARDVRGRGVEPPGVGIAPAQGVRRPGPGHRSHVADRDRWPGRRKPLRDIAASHQAGLSRHRPAWLESRHRRRRRQPRGHR